MTQSLTAQEVAKHVRYEPKTGRVVRLVGNSKCPAGAEAGSADSRTGYRYLSVARRRVAVHRVAILLSTGRWPRGEVDHINGVKSDNRLQNLRDVDRRTNAQNLHGPQRNNRSSGLLGVTWNKRAGKWQAQIKVGDSLRYLGLFVDPNDGHQAYLQAKRESHPGCTI